MNKKHQCDGERVKLELLGWRFRHSHKNRQIMTQCERSQTWPFKGLQAQQKISISYISYLGGSTGTNNHFFLWQCSAAFVPSQFLPGLPHTAVCSFWLSCRRSTLLHAASSLNASMRATDGWPQPPALLCLTSLCVCWPCPVLADRSGSAQARALASRNPQPGSSASREAVRCFFPPSPLR